MPPRILLAMLFCAHLIAQSDVAFPPAVYAARRARLLEQVPDAVLVVPGRYLVGEEGLWKQEPNF